MVIDFENIFKSEMLYPIQIWDNKKFYLRFLTSQFFIKVDNKSEDQIFLVIKF
jgi:hypothetical protein